MTDAIGRMLPIILLIGLGVVIKKKKIIDSNGMQGMRTFAVNVALPMVLLSMFMDIELDLDYIYISVATVIILIATMLGGLLFNFIPPLKSRYNIFVSSCCSYSFVGLSLFVILYGEGRLAYFSAIGLAHELFVWIIYYSILRIRIGNNSFSPTELLKVFTSPVVMGMIVGLLLNFSYLPITLIDNPFWKGFRSSIEMVSLTATPIILVLLGYSLSLNRDYIKQAVKLLSVRYIVTAVVAVVLKVLVIDRLFSYDPLIDITFTAFLLLPPVVSLPALVGDMGDEDGVEILSNTAALGNIIAIPAFALYYLYISWAQLI